MQRKYLFKENPLDSPREVLPLSKESVDPQSIPEVRHDLLIRHEYCYGRPIKSYEIGPQDLIDPNRDYIIDSQYNQILGNQNLKYAQHPLYKILETSEETPFHSNWHERIEWAVENVYDTFNEKIMKSEQITHVIKQELNFSREFRCFSDAARDGCVLLIRGLFEQTLCQTRQSDLLQRLGFISITDDTYSDVWNVYCPFFKRDRVFIRDGLVFTMINGGQQILNASGGTSKNIIQLRDAEKSYGAALKSSQVVIEAIMEYRKHQANPSKKSSLSSPSSANMQYCKRERQELPLPKIALPVVAIVKYATIRIFVEPYIVLSPKPKDLLSESSLLFDTELLDELDFIRRRVGLELNPFRFHDDNRALANRPQILSRWKSPKYYLRRLSCILPPMIVTDAKALNEPWSARFRPEFLINSVLHNRQRTLCQAMQSWFGHLKNGDEYGVGSESSLCSHEPDAKYERTITAVVDADLSREERLLRQYDEIGTVRPFTSSPNVQKMYRDNTYTRNVVADNHSHLVGCGTIIERPNQKAIGDLANLVLPSLAAQLHDCLFICQDVVQLSQCVHSVGLPIHYLPILRSHPLTPSSLRLLIDVDLFARQVTHWFAQAVRPGILRDLFEEMDLRDDVIPTMSGPMTLERDTIQLFRFLLRDIQLNSIGPELKCFWKLRANEIEDYPAQLLVQALQFHLGVLVELSNNNNMAKGSVSTNIISVDCLMDFMKPARKNWDLRRGSDVTINGRTEILTNGDLTSTKNVLFPHIGSIQEMFIGQCLTKLPTLPHQVAEAIGRVFQGFIPCVRIVSPLPSLGFIEASRFQLITHLHKNLSIPAGMYLTEQSGSALSQEMSSQTLSGPFGSATSSLKYDRYSKYDPNPNTFGSTGYLRPIDGIQNRTDIHQFTNPTIFGNIFPLKAALLGGSAPCHPVCRLLTKRELQEILESTPIQVPGIYYWPNLLNSFDKLLADNVKNAQNAPSASKTFNHDSDDMSNKSPRLCRKFLDILSSTKLLCLSRQTSTTTGIINGGSCMYGCHSEFVDYLRFDLLTLCYLHLQHNSLYYARSIAQYILKTNVMSKSIELKGQELLLQCSLREGNSIEAETVLHKIYQSIDSPEEAIHNNYNLSLLSSHLSLAAFYFYYDRNMECMKHIKRVVTLCHTEFGNDSGHWLTLVAFQILARVSLKLGEYLVPITTCRQGIRASRLTPYSRLIEPLFLLTLATVYEKCHKYKEGCETATSALQKLDDSRGSLHPESLTCLLLLARFHSHYGIGKLIQPSLHRRKSSTDLTELPTESTSGRLRRFDGIHWNLSENEAPYPGMTELKNLCRALDREFQKKEKTESGDANQEWVKLGDTDVIEELWEESDRREARQKGIRLYDQLFQRFALRRKLARLRHVILDNETFYDPDITNSLLYKTVQIPIPIENISINREVDNDQSRLLAIIKEALELKVISLTFQQQRSFIADLIHFAVIANYPTTTPSESTSLVATEQQGLFEPILDEENVILVAPLGVTSSQLSELLLVVEALFAPPTIPFGVICQKLLDHCLLPMDITDDDFTVGKIVWTDIMKPPIKMRLSEWFDYLVTKALSRSVSLPSEHFVLFFDLLRHLCPGSIKKILLAHVMMGHPTGMNQIALDAVINQLEKKRLQEIKQEKTFERIMKKEIQSQKKAERRHGRMSPRRSRSTAGSTEDQHHTETPLFFFSRPRINGSIRLG